MRKLLLPLSLIVTTSLTFALLFTADAASKENPATRRAACPTDYLTSFQAIRGPGYFAKRKLVTTTYANAQALRVTDLALPYAHGSVFLVEYAEPIWAEDGTPRRDSTGTLLKGKVVRLDVMERGSGFGEAYGEDRAGE